MKGIDKQQYHYIYKVTRIFDKKYYIGMHSTSYLNDDYFGSGTHLLNSIKKHGKDKHIKEILEFLPTRKALKEREKEIIDKELLEDPFCMNVIIGGSGWSSDDASKIARKNWQDFECKEKMLKGFSEQWQDIKYREKMSKCLSERNKKNWQDIKYREKMSNIMKKQWQIPEYRAKMKWLNVGSNSSQYGTMWIKHSELRSKKINKDDPIPAGWEKGRRMN